MAITSKVLITKGYSTLDLISTNRLNSTFRITGGPKKFDTIDIIGPDLGGKFFLLDLTPKFVGQLMYSNTLEINGQIVSLPFNARMFLVVRDPVTQERLGVPVYSYYLNSTINEYTGEAIDPVGIYTCDPPWLCPGS